MAIEVANAYAKKIFKIINECARNYFKHIEGHV